MGMIQIAQRLRLAREAAGFATATDAAARFGWAASTYAGHENGHRGIRTSVLADYARAFRVDASWLLNGSGAGPGSNRAGMAEDTRDLFEMREPDFAPYIPPDAAAARALEGLAAVLCPGWRHLQKLSSRRDWPAYAIAAGDLIICGTPPDGPSDGDVVVATWSDPDSVTLLGQRSGDSVILPPREPAPASQPAILGTVALVLRPPVR